ncbi:hypothetical protein HK096_006104, partial [Nowakowskiella sp. JEL0078]
MSVSVSVVLVLKKENGDEHFMLDSEFPSTFAAFREKVLLKIEQELPPGFTFMLKYKSNHSHQTFKLCDDGDVKRVLSEPSSFEILAFPTKSPENAAESPQQPAHDILLSFFNVFNFFCRAFEGSPSSPSLPDGSKPRVQ